MSVNPIHSRSSLQISSGAPPSPPVRGGISHTPSTLVSASEETSFPCSCIQTAINFISSLFRSFWTWITGKAPSSLQVQNSAQQPTSANTATLEIAESKVVFFYKGGPTEYLGNFALCPNGLIVWGQNFRCAEAAFQWKKYQLAAQNNNRPDMLANPLMNQFFTADGERAFQLRQRLDTEYPNVFPRGWRQGGRDAVMWEVLIAKFQQNPAFRNLLQATQGSYLLEHNERRRDDYWSDNHDGSGLNRLGDLLMAGRDHGFAGIAPAYNPSKHLKKTQYAQYANLPGALQYNIFAPCSR